MRREIVTEIHIQADPLAVWAVLLDFRAYPEWNPFIRSISGEADTGARLDVTIEPPGLRPMRFRPQVLRAMPARELSWLGRLGVPGLFDGEHRFMLEADEERGGTRLLHREKFSGILLPLMWWLTARATRRGFEAMNQALKYRVEQADGPADTPAR
ncbi:SRPBCC domain-containing protein [Aquisalimonas sp.]|uniref:SRPBCC domain-containing protein n=1 Tax=Aquisalimonas sp. TaxID=1872621 RepID=UPI0025C3CCE4|nr:SRPBCC domain-containing protein [Aquisalimonas sp.]